MMVYLKTGSEQGYDEALQFVQEAADVFRDTGSRHLPEAEATLEELQGLGISKDTFVPVYTESL